MCLHIIEHHNIKSSCRKWKTSSNLEVWNCYPHGRGPTDRFTGKGAELLAHLKTPHIQCEGVSHKLFRLGSPPKSTMVVQCPLLDISHRLCYKHPSWWVALLCFRTQVPIDFRLSAFSFVDQIRVERDHRIWEGLPGCTKREQQNGIRLELNVKSTFLVQCPFPFLASFILKGGSNGSKAISECW